MKKVIREFLDCGANPILLNVNSFPEGMYYKQEAILAGRRLMFMGVDEENCIWFVYLDQDGLYRAGWDKTKLDLIRHGVIFE